MWHLVSEYSSFPSFFLLPRPKDSPSVRRIDKYTFQEGREFVFLSFLFYPCCGVPGGDK